MMYRNNLSTYNISMSYVDTKIVALTSQSATIKYNGTYLSNLRYNLGTILQRDPDIIHRQVQLLNAQIPVSFYVINYTNNQFSLKLGAGALTTYTIPVGNYNGNSLISAIKTVVNVTGFNIVISTINGCLTFSYTSTLQIDNTINSSIGYVLGFASGIYNSVSNAIIAPYALNLLGIKTLQIRSGNLIMNNISSVQGGMTTLLGTIPVSAVPFGMIEYKDVGNNLITIYNDFLDDIDIEVVDGENDNYINFNNQDWCITLAFHITRRIPEILSSIIPSEKPSAQTPLANPQPLSNNLASPLEENPKESKAPENPDINDLELLLREN